MVSQSAATQILDSAGQSSPEENQAHVQEAVYKHINPNDDRPSPGVYAARRFFLRRGRPMGTFYVKLGREEAKLYGCVYTCLATRAVHIKVLSSGGFFRFMAHRGTSTKVFSDNGIYLVGALNELSQCLRQLDRAKIGRSACAQEFTLQSLSPVLARYHPFAVDVSLNCDIINQSVKASVTGFVNLLWDNTTQF